MEQTITDINDLVEKKSAHLVTLDNIIGSGSQMAVSLYNGNDINTAIKTTGVIFLSHWVLHSSIDKHSKMNPIKHFQSKLPRMLPIDGIIVGGLAWYFNGPFGALFWALTHGPIHTILQK